MSVQLTALKGSLFRDDGERVVHRLKYRFGTCGRQGRGLLLGVRKIAQACQGRQNARGSRIPSVENMVKDGIVGKAALLILTHGTFWRRCRGEDEKGRAV